MTRRQALAAQVDRLAQMTGLPLTLTYWGTSQWYVIEREDGTGYAHYSQFLKLGEMESAVNLAVKVAESVRGDSMTTQTIVDRDFAALERALPAPYYLHRDLDTWRVRVYPDVETFNRIEPNYIVVSVEPGKERGDGIGAYRVYRCVSDPSLTHKLIPTIREIEWDVPAEQIAALVQKWMPF